MAEKPVTTRTSGQCWAALIGNCSGPITSEHLVTKALFSKKVKVVGGKWGKEPKDLTIKKFCENILCQKHNNELGKTADAAALRLVDHLRAIQDPMRLPGSNILRKPVTKRVSGHSFARWLCKTHCNLMIANDETPNPMYVKYAFGELPGNELHFYLAADVGEVLHVADRSLPVVSWKRLAAPNDTSYEGFEILLAGLVSVVSDRPINRLGSPMIDRMREIVYPTPLGNYRICFDWSREPSCSSKS